MEEYNKSAHAGVNCEQCHTKPGPFFFLTSKLEALQQPIAQITGDYEKPILGFVLNQSCRRCHTNDDLFKTISSSGIRVNHQHLIEAGFLCQRCHSTTAHGDAIPEGSRTYPVMEQCLICHNNEFKAADGTVATSRCDLCHTKRDYGAKPVSHDEEGLVHPPRRRRRALHLQRLPPREGRLLQVPRRHPHAAPRAVAVRARQDGRGQGPRVVRAVPQHQGVLQDVPQGAHAAPAGLRLESSQAG